MRCMAVVKRSTSNAIEDGLSTWNCDLWASRGQLLIVTSVTYSAWRILALEDQIFIIRASHPLCSPTPITIDYILMIATATVPSSLHSNRTIRVTTTLCQHRWKFSPIGSTSFSSMASTICISESILKGFNGGMSIMKLVGKSQVLSGLQWTSSMIFGSRNLNLRIERTRDVTQKLIHGSPCIV